MSSNAGSLIQLTNIIRPRSKILGLNLNADQSSITAPLASHTKNFAG